MCACVCVYIYQLCVILNLHSISEPAGLFDNGLCSQLLEDLGLVSELEQDRRLHLGLGHS